MKKLIFILIILLFSMNLYSKSAQIILNKDDSFDKSIDWSSISLAKNKDNSNEVTKFKITNNNSINLTDFQVKLNFDPSSDTELSKCNADTSLLGVYTENDQKINYWIESWSSTSANVWVKVPNIPANGSAIIKLYCDTNLKGESNPDNTFVFYDDFNSVESRDKWYSGYANGSYNQNNISTIIPGNGWAYINRYGNGGSGDERLYSKKEFPVMEPNIAYHKVARIYHYAGIEGMYIGFNNLKINYVNDAPWRRFVIYTINGTVYHNHGHSTTFNGIQHFIVWRDSSNVIHAKSITNDGYVLTTSINSQLHNNSFRKLNFASYVDRRDRIDWVYVYKDLVNLNPLLIQKIN